MKEIGCTYILIPSIGRESLRQICKDIIEDAEGFDIRIIVISDGHEAAAKISRFSLNDNRIIFAKNKFSPGISGAINTGLELVPKGGQIMFFSDDDQWLPGKISKSLNAYLKYTDTCLIFQVRTSQTGERSIVKPGYVPKESSEPFRYLYSKPQLLRNRRYFSLTSFIGPSEVAQISFREDLQFREDIEWVNRVTKSNFPLFLIEGVTAHVEIGYLRTVERESIEQLKIFSSILRVESPEIEAKYIGWFFLRPYVVTGRVSYGMKILIRGKFLKRISNRKELLGIIFLSTLGTMVKIKTWVSYFPFPRAKN
jgi:hypothetical protein